MCVHLLEKFLHYSGVKLQFLDAKLYMPETAVEIDRKTFDETC